MLSTRRELTDIFTELHMQVLENINTAEGKQLEALISLASQICYALPPQCFVQGLESRIEDKKGQG